MPKLRENQTAESNPSRFDAPLKIAYTIQNVGLDLSQRVGDTVPVWYTLDGLRALGHKIAVFMLSGRSITKIADVTGQPQTSTVPLGVTGKRPFHLLESGVRRAQLALNLPYFAFIDSARFYEACLNSLPPYALVHEHNGLFSPATALACRRLKKPYVLTFSADPILERNVVNDPLTGLHRRVAERQARLTYDQADQILCVSNAAKQHLVTNWQVDPEKVNVMPNGVEIELFTRPFDPLAVRAQWALGSGPVIGFVGGFQKWHGLDRLVKSFALLLKDVPDARLFLVGDGPYRAELDREIAGAGVQEQTVITGLVPQTDVPRLMAAMDIATLPYPRLPQDLWFSPLKLYEYMAAGKAIVASRSGQIAEVIENGETGLLVEPGSITDLHRALQSLVRSRAERERLGENGRSQAVHYHSWSRYVAKVEQIYEKALHHHPRRQR